MCTAKPLPVGTILTSHRNALDLQSCCARALIRIAFLKKFSVLPYSWPYQQEWCEPHGLEGNKAKAATKSTRKAAPTSRAHLGLSISGS